MESTLQSTDTGHEAHIRHMAARVAGMELDHQQLEHGLRRAHFVRAQHVNSLVAAALRALVRSTATLWQRCCEHQERVWAVRTLEGFDDRMLSDIGIRRGQIREAVAGTVCQERDTPGTRTATGPERRTRESQPEVRLAA